MSRVIGLAVLATFAAGPAIPAQSPPPAYVCVAQTQQSAPFGHLTVSLNIDADGKITRRIVRWAPMTPRGALTSIGLLYHLTVDAAGAKVGPAVNTVDIALEARPGPKGPATARISVQVLGGAQAAKPWNVYAEERAKGRNKVAGAVPFFRGDGASNAMMDSLDRAVAAGSVEIETKVVGDDGTVLSTAKFTAKDMAARDRTIAALGTYVEQQAKSPQRSCMRVRPQR